MIGYAEYQCSCVKYVQPIDPRVIVGVAIAAALLLFLLVLLIFLLYRRLRRKQATAGSGVTSTELDQKLDKRGQYSRQLPDYVKSEDNDTQYSQQLPDDYAVDSNF